MHGRNGYTATDLNLNVNNLLAISESDFDNSGEPGPQAEGKNYLETPLRQLHVAHRTSSCAKRGGHVQLCSKPRGARGIEPETFLRRGQLLSRPPTTGQMDVPTDVMHAADNQLSPCPQSLLHQAVWQIPCLAQASWSYLDRKQQQLCLQHCKNPGQLQVSLCCCWEQR